MKIVLPFLIGLLSFLLMANPQILDVQFVDWIPTGDNLTNYIGWVQYRNSPWTLPWGLSKFYGDFFSSSVVYSDSIPLLAMLFKAFSAYLPEQFQFFGIWYLTCFIFQAYFGYKIADLIDCNQIQKILICILFIFSPAFLCTINVNPPLAGHFLILASIYIVLRNTQEHRIYFWTLILIISAGIQFYIFAPIALVWLANTADLRFFSKKISSREYIKELFVIAATLVAFAWFSGYFAIVTEKVGQTVNNMGPGGYGTEIWSLNLASLVYSDTWSAIYKFFGLAFKVNNGFNYLGAGFILMIVICLFYMPKYFSRGWVQANFFLIISLIFLVLFSITHEIRVGNYGFSIQLPNQISSFASILRSSSRIFWIPYYFIMVFVINVIIKQFGTKYSTAILIFALILQILDTSEGWGKLRKGIAEPQNYFFSDSFTSSFWDCEKLRSNFQGIYRVPAVDYDQAWEAFGFLAARCALPSTFALLNRPDRTKISAFNYSFDRAISDSKLDANNIYIIDPSYVYPIRQHLNENNLFFKINGYNVFIPDVLSCNVCKVSNNFDKYERLLLEPIALGQEISFKKDAKGSNYLYGVDQAKTIGWGWAYPESWGVWSEGKKAILFLPLIRDQHYKELILKIKAFNPKGDNQVIGVTINNEYFGSFTLSTNSDNSVTLPIKNSGDVDFLTIVFDITTAFVPADYDENSMDYRKLAIGLISAEIK